MLTVLKMLFTDSDSFIDDVLSSSDAKTEGGIDYEVFLKELYGGKSKVGKVLLD